MIHSPNASPSCNPHRIPRLPTRVLLTAALVAAPAVLAPAHAAHGQGLIQVLAETGGASPDGNGPFDMFANPVINQAGQVAFTASLGSELIGSLGNAVYRVDPDGLTLIDRDNFFLGTTTDVGFASPDLNDAGQVLYTRLVTPNPAFGSPRQELVRSTGGLGTVIAAGGADAPDGNGQFDTITGFSLNAAGQAVFRGGLVNTAGGAGDNTGIFLGDGGAATQIARAGQALPGGNHGVFVQFSGTSLRLNDAGDVAFRAFDNLGTEGGVFIHNGGGLITAAAQGEPAPGTDGVFGSIISNIQLDDSGRAVFAASASQTSTGTVTGLFRSDGTPEALALGNQPDPGTTNTLLNVELGSVSAHEDGGTAFAAGEGLFRLDDVGLTPLLRAGAEAPDGNGFFIAFDNPQINAAGQVLFRGRLAETAAAELDNEGLFLTNGIDTLQVAREIPFGESGMPVSLLVLTNNPTNRTLLNDAGQVVFTTRASDGDESVSRFSIPDLAWTGGGSGFWDDDSNWLFATTPNSFHDAAIATDTALTVSTSTQRTTHAASLTLGGGAGVSTLRLSGINAGDFRTLEASTILANGVLELNQGRSFVAPELLNQGAIRGTGTIDAVLTNEGQIEAIGSDLTFTQHVTNAADTGLITGRDGTLRFDGGLDNDGALAFTFGNTDVFGDLTNDDRIVVTGNATATFFDDVQNNAQINVANGSSAVFFGGLSGNGIGGTGTVFLEGDIRPGFSPNQTVFEGDVVFGFLNELEIELAGLIPGDEFDHIDIAGTATLGGALEVVLLDGFAPKLGDSFAFLTAGEVLGSFNDVVLPELGGGRFFELSQDATSVNLTVVPEPASISLVLLGAASILSRRRRS